MPKRIVAITKTGTYVYWVEADGYASWPEYQTRNGQIERFVKPFVYRPLLAPKKG